MNIDFGEDDRNEDDESFDAEDHFAQNRNRGHSLVALEDNFDQYQGEKGSDRAESTGSQEYIAAREGSLVSPDQFKNHLATADFKEAEDRSRENSFSEQVTEDLDPIVVDPTKKQVFEY